MKINFIVMGKTAETHLKWGIELYEKRLAKYASFNIITLPDVKSGKKMNENVLKSKEGEKLLACFKAGDFVVLLDEAGKQYHSLGFAEYLQQLQNRSIKNLCFVVGGAYGFSPDVYERADAKISLSKMTFSHQLVRLVFVEQLYRAFTILRNEPYHHE